ncbi:hypothetical protein EGH24_02480 [Halonotius terrestris]|uniref:Uncharacterized protein n=1 Tax=Halonotius terrestris TaxID=2487750 RepID=A0A8J8PFG4_9EURY|nr:hypothetical protein [Halonotius terrestris]TQQ83672.1 hypothetical protein EGH24_02480 [Halonotius terrestris]
MPPNDFPNNDDLTVDQETDELSEFVDFVAERDDTIAELVATEVAIAAQVHSELDDEVQAQVSIPDLLPKVDDALDRIKDWWDDR